MQTTLAVLALAGAVYAAPQGVTAVLTPTASAPAGCATSYSGEFEITAYNLSSSSKRDLEKRACGAAGSLTIKLADGKLTDGAGRTGYIADNRQFQFDAPPQTGAKYTAGWSACSNGSLALGGSSVFYQCKSGNPKGGDAGAFYNLYDESVFDICNPVLINILPCSGSVGEQADGQPTGASATAAPATQIGDGQPQIATALPLPVSQISDGQAQVPTGAPISELSDGQPQVPTGAPISQISDGQIQAPTSTAAPVSQISDGQVQAPTGAPITQISDGQIQAPTSTSPPITQISDGQIQAPTGAPNATSSPIQVVNSAASFKAGIFTIFAAVVAAVAFL